MSRSPGKPLVPPVYRCAAFEFGSAEELRQAIADPSSAYSYGRFDNPTVADFEEKIAALEGAERAVAFGSGMAAISTTVLALLRPGGRIVLQREVYGGTAEFFREYLPRLGGRVVEVSAREPDRMEEAIRQGADLVYLETPVNPTLDVVDLARMGRASRAAGALSIVDNTFATPLGQRPLRLGLDVSLHSATKFLGGHHDVIAGVTASSAEIAGKIWRARKILGGILSPADAFLLTRGLKTLALRFESASRTAAALARQLAADDHLAQVRYPGLPQDPSHAIAASQMKSFGAMIALELRGGRRAAVRFLDALRLIRRAGSLGGVESLALLPAETSHAGLPAEERRRRGIREGLVRLSVGTEPEELLREDLERGLARAAS